MTSQAEVGERVWTLLEQADVLRSPGQGRMPNFAAEDAPDRLAVLRLWYAAER